MNRSNAHRLAAQAGHAFSLIEVLIGVTVLALGLIGLAAVFPAVIRQQQIASDAVLALSAERSIREFILSYQPLNTVREYTALEYYPPRPDGSPSLTNQNPWRVNPRATDAVTDAELTLPNFRLGWQTLVCQVSNDPRTSFSMLGEWVTPTPLEQAASNPANIRNGVLWQSTQSGELYVGQSAARGLEPREGEAVASLVAIHTADRLSPTIGWGDENYEPKFVWDMAARRIDAGRRNVYAPRALDNTIDSLQETATYFDDRVQLAVFVRRLDSGIRGTGLGQAIRYGAIIPVAAAPDGSPSLDGRGNDGGGARNYSRIQSGTIRFPALPDLSIVSMESIDEYGASLLPYVQQQGQKLVDALGVVHTVTQVGAASAGGGSAIQALAFTVDPPFSREIYDRSELGNPGQASTILPIDGPVGDVARRVLFTPQIPAGVVVITVEPGSSKS